MRITLAYAGPYPTGQGSQVLVRGTARALAARGHAVTVVAYGHGDAGDDPGVRVVRVPSPPGYRRRRSGPDPVKPALDLALAARLAALPADLVYAHHVEALAAARLARRRGGPPVVYAAHTLLAEELPTYAPALAGLGRVGAALDRLAVGADAVVALSERAAAALRALGCRRVGVVHPGLDPAEVEGVGPRRTGAGPTVVYAGNPDRYQDLDVLRAAMARAPELRLRVVTSEPRWPWPAEVVVARRWSEAAPWIAGADVAALPRAVCAGFPMKLLACLGLGVPVVVARGSARGLPGERVVPDRDPAALAAALRAAVADGVRPDPAAVLAGWSWASRAATLERMFEGIVRDATTP